MKWKLLRFALVSAFSVACAGVALAQSTVQPTILYLSAGNCPVCRAFEADVLLKYKASPEARRIPIRELRRADLRLAMLDGDWPDDLRWVPQATQVSSATPAFVVIQGHQVLVSTFGNAFQGSVIESAIQALASTPHGSGPFDGVWTATTANTNGCAPTTWYLDINNGSVSGFVKGSLGTGLITASTLSPDGAAQITFGLKNGFQGALKFSGRQFQGNYAQSCGQNSVVGSKQT